MKRRSMQKKDVLVTQGDGTLTPQRKDERTNQTETASIIAFFAFVLLAVFVASDWMPCLLMVLCVALGLQKSSFENLREHISLPVVGLIGLVLIYGISGIITPFGAAVEQELFRGLCAFTITVIAMLRFKKKHIPLLLWGIAIIIAIVSFSSLDGGSSGILFNAVRVFVNLLGGSMSSFDPVQGQRLAGIVNNANTMASIAAIGMLVGLYQINTEQETRFRFIAACLLGVNAVTFWLCLSRGAILCFAVALLVYLLFTRRGERLGLFLLMAGSALTTLVFGSLASTRLGMGTLLPDLFGLACGPIIFLLYKYFMIPLGELLKPRIRFLTVGGVVLAGACVSFVIVSLQLTGPYTLESKNDVLDRAVNLTPGETYTVSGDWDGDLNLVVYVVRENNLAKGETEVIYRGSINGAEFTIPQDVAKTHVQFRNGEGQELRNVIFSDGTPVKLDYLLLPAAIEGRLQDRLITSVSLHLRIQYVKDALTLWKEAPLFGRGLASTDSLYPSVQPFFYATKYVHNHIIQYLVDIGVVGVLCFLLVTGGVIFLLFRRRKEENCSLIAVFLACMVMIHSHSMMEVTFSVRAYLIIAYLFMGVIAIYCGEPMFLKGKKKVKKGTDIAVVAILALNVVFACICVSSQVVEKVATKKQFTNQVELMDCLEKYIKFDALDDAYFKTVYIARGHGNPYYQTKVDKFALELRASGMFTNCDSVARYYYLPMGAWSETFACTREGIAAKASDAEAWNGELDFYRATVLEAMEPSWDTSWAVFVQEVLKTAEYLEEHNSRSMEPIALSKDNQAFLVAVEEIREDPTITPDEAYTRLSQYSEAESEW